MKNKLLLILATCLSINASATVAKYSRDSLIKSCGYNEEQMKPIEPTYLDDVTVESGWRDNWFVNVSGGASAFIGSPMGCDDLFGRIKPAFSIQLGKWFTSRVGARIAYQGMWFKDCESMSQKYHHAHTDFLWNPMGRNYNARDRPFDIVPYAGVGLLHHRSNGNNSFALSYGLIGRYRLAQRLHLTMELGGTTTFKNFDGYGDSREFGDNLLSLTAGVSITIGRAGWKHVVDARPYIKQNEWLQDYIEVLAFENSRLCGKLYDAAKYNAELKKILEIEGLLKKYQGQLSKYADSAEYDEHPRNDYSGLNSLMRRLHGTNKNNTVAASSHSREFGEGDCIGAPIYVFFKLGTANLTDESHQINIDAIARVAKKYGLLIKIFGAADSVTGNVEINNRLSSDRAHYICSQLRQRGIAADCISTVSEGGIDAYSPNEANRNTRIELHQK